MTNPELGVGLIVGSKTTQTASSIVNSIITTVNQDPRFQSCQAVSVNQNGSTLAINLSVVLAQINQPVPVTVNIN